MKLTNTKPVLEIAAHSLMSAINAQAGGADRIELCTALQTGGLTPAIGLIELIKEQIEIPVHVLIRPRVGNFQYNSREVTEMVRSIVQCKESGVEGVVLGCLTDQYNVDIEVMTDLTDAAKGMDITFHRAFDLTQDPYKSLEVIIDLQFDRILTSGQQIRVTGGVEIVKDLVQMAKGEISIMPGAGVNQFNAKKIILETGCYEIHASAKKERSSIVKPSLVAMMGGGPLSKIWETDTEEVRAIRTAIDSI